MTVDAKLKTDFPTLRNALIKRAQTQRWLARGQIMAGLLATVLIPAVAAVFCAIGFNRHRAWGNQPGTLDWWAWFVISFVVLMPLAYFMEWRTQGGFLMQKLSEIENSDGGWYEAVTRDRSWRWGAREGAAQWEIFLFAPRMVFAGFAKLRGIRMVAVADTTRAAEVLGVLIGQEHGVVVEGLRRASESPLAFSQVMSYLLFFEWVGASENGQKAWALTETREELCGSASNKTA